MPIEIDQLKELPTLPCDEPTSFPEAVQVYPTAEAGRYSAYIPADWTFGPNAHGGLTASIVVRAAQVECDKRLGQGKLPHTTASTTHFFNRVKVGAAEVRVDALHIHPAMSVFRSGLYQKNKLCIEATVTQGHLGKSSLSNLSLPTPSVTHFTPFNVQNAEVGKVLEEQGWVRTAKHDHGIGFYKHKPNFVTYSEPGTNMQNAHIPHPEYGPSVRDHWWTATPWNSASLPLLVDLSMPIHWNYPEGSGYFVASRSMSYELRMEPPAQGWTWLFMRTELRDCTNGTYVVDITLVDEKGQTMALGRSCYAAIPIARLKKGASNPTKKQQQQKKTEQEIAKL